MKNDGYLENELLDACAYGDILRIKRLLSSVTNIDYQNAQGETALMQSVCHGHHDIVELLIDNKANLEITDCNGNTALIYAAIQREILSLSTLLSANANVDHQNSSGDTALIISSEIGDEYIVEKLLENGANKDIVNSDKSTAFDMSQNNPYIQVLLNPELINKQDKQGRTLLLNALLIHNEKLTLFLINKGANFDIMSSFGKSPYDLMVEKNFESDILNTLKEKLILDKMIDNDVTSTFSL